ncbi:hypothetical protein ES332_A08G164900v1, partial [Gossypium tomentosum]
SCFIIADLIKSFTFLLHFQKESFYVFQSENLRRFFSIAHRTELGMPPSRVKNRLGCQDFTPTSHTTSPDADLKDC